jgi:hypothetical protein
MLNQYLPKEHPMYNKMPIELLQIAVDHYRFTGKTPSFGFLDTAEWQMCCPMPSDEPDYADEVAFYVNHRPDRPMRYFYSEAWGGSSGEWLDWISVEDAAKETRKYFAPLI